VQGTDAPGAAGREAAIIDHPDVRRMLLTMKAHTEAMRALAYVVAARTIDRGRAHIPTSEAAHGNQVASTC
jgi:alkylation response protein AidB-like acyl-CoA dehydrogenase